MTPTPPSFSTVLCPVDLSGHSKATLYLAAGLTFAAGSRLVVLLVDNRGAGDPPAEAEVRMELEQFVLDALPGAAGYREGLELMVRAGTPPSTILAVAAERQAELIVAGSSGRGALGRALFGSTTSELLRQTRIPLAIVPPSHPEVISLAETRAVPHFGMILVPVDLQAESDAQMAFAARLSSGSEHHLFLVTVIGGQSDIEGASTRLNALTHQVAVPAARGWRILAHPGRMPDTVVSIVHRERIGIVVLGKSSDAPGKLAYELIQQTNAVVVMVP